MGAGFRRRLFLERKGFRDPVETRGLAVGDFLRYLRCPIATRHNTLAY
jgi:hypothetical protein